MPGHSDKERLQGEPIAVLVEGDDGSGWLAAYGAREERKFVERAGCERRECLLVGGGDMDRVLCHWRYPP